MKSKGLTMLIIAAVAAAFFSLIISRMLISTPKDRSSQVPSVAVIDEKFPDVRNSPQYQAIFNDRALDPTVPVQIGNSQNQRPFNSQ